MSKQKLKSAGFQSPNYTQTPNDFFDLISDMDNAELRVTLVMIRETFGYHRDGFKMGINKLAEAAGLSRNGAKAGAEAAEERGTFRRSNPDAQGSAEWELVVVSGGAMSAPPDDFFQRGAASDQGGGQPVTRGGSASDPQSRVKESIKESIKEKEITTTTTDSPAPKKSKVAVAYEKEIGTLTPMVADALNDAEREYPEDWIIEALQIAVERNARNWRFVLAVLKDSKARNVRPSLKKLEKKHDNNKSGNTKRAAYADYTDAAKAAAEHVKRRRADM